MRAIRERWRTSPTGARLGAALLLLGLLAVAASLLFGGQREGEPQGGDQPVNEGAGNRGDIRAHNSPTVVRNPRRPGNVVVSNRIDTPAFSCALNVSFDGGDSWSQTQIAIPRGEEPKCYAPDVSFGSDGTLHLSFVTLRGIGNVPNAGWVVSSRDGGRTLSRPVKVLGRLAFQVRIAADPSDPDTLYLTWLQASEVGLFKFTSLGNPIRAVRSDDGGASWGRPARVSNPARARVVAPSPAIGPKGELYVLYLDLGEDRLDYEGAHGGAGGPPYEGRFKLVLGRSLDRGANWRESVVEERLVPTERFLAFLPPFPSVAVDPGSGRVYAGFQDGRLGAPDVWVWSLPPRTGSWEGPRRVNDTPERDGSAQYLPKLAVAPNGRLDVVYYDRRSDPRNVLNEVSLQSSFDEGKSFTESVRLSGQGFSSRVGFGSERRLPDLGSRLGLTSDDASAFAVWTDTRAGTEASNKQDLSRALVAFNEPALSPTAEDALRYGGLALSLVGLLLLVASLRRSRTETASPVGRDRVS